MELRKIPAKYTLRFKNISVEEIYYFIDDMTLLLMTFRLVPCLQPLVRKRNSCLNLLEGTITSQAVRNGESIILPTVYASRFTGQNDGKETQQSSSVFRFVK